MNAINSRIWLTWLFIFALASVFCFAQPARAACNEGEQQVSIGFPGAIERNGSYCVPINKGSNQLSDSPIWVLLRGIVQFLVAGVGLAVIGGVLYGGFMYMTARGNSSQTQKAIEIIIHAAIGLLLYIFMFAALNFLIPGGILS